MNLMKVAKNSIFCILLILKLLNLQEEVFGQLYFLKILRAFQQQCMIIQGIILILVIWNLNIFMLQKLGVLKKKMFF